MIMLDEYLNRLLYFRNVLIHYVALTLWCRYGIFIVNFEHISHLSLVFLLLTLNM